MREITAKALQMRRLGFSVIRITPGVKKPLVTWKEWQAELPSEELVLHWFEGRFRHADYAILSGATSGVVAVDGDDADALVAMAARLAPTPMRQRTGRGEQWLYRHPCHPVSNRVKASIQGVRYAIDIRGDGGIIVGPASTHRTGKRYTEIEPWTADMLALVPVFDPSWFDPEHLPQKTRNAVAVVSCEAGSVRQRKAQVWLDTAWGGGPVLGTQAGRQAQARCFWVACQLVHGFDLDPDEALSLLTTWGQRPDQLDEYGSYYPWSEQELNHKLVDANQRENPDGKPRGFLLRSVLLREDFDRLDAMWFRKQKR